MKKMIPVGPGTRLRENNDLSLLRANASHIKKSRHFLNVCTLITHKIMRSTGCALQY